MPAKKRNISRLYIFFQIFFDLLIWLPVFYQFQELMGLSHTQILFIQSLHYFSFFIFEIPTGYFADRYGYGHSMRLGALIFTMANLLVIAWPLYWGFLSHFILVALARSLVSGAANAYLYEYLKSIDKKEEYKIIEGKARAFNLLAKVITWSSVGLMMEKMAFLPYWMTTFCGIIAFFVALQLPVLPAELRFKRLHKRTKALKNSKDVLINLSKSPYLLLVLLISLGVFVLGRLEITFYQPLLENKGVGLQNFGWILASMTLFEAIGAYKPKWILKKASDLNSLFLLTLILSFSFAGIAFFEKWGTLAMLSLFSFVIGLSFPVQKQLLNDAITDSSHRATLLSIESMLDRVTSAWMIWLFTPFAQKGKLNDIPLWSGLGIILFTCLVFLILKFMTNSHKRKTLVAEIVKIIRTGS